MMRLLLASLLFAASPAFAEAFKPYHVISLSGTATLTRFEDEVWPMETGQDLTGDFSLSLDKGATIHLRALKRVDIAIAGPASLKSYVIDRQNGDLMDHDLILRLEKGEYFIDPRFLLSHPSQIRFDLPDSEFDLKNGETMLLSVEAGQPTKRTVNSDFLCSLDAEPVGALLLARDYDKELKVWARPAILGPALLTAMTGIPGLTLVDGSGNTSLSAYANGAIRKGDDFFLQQLARERGARFVVVGNLVSEEVRDDNLARTSLMSAAAEIRILESAEGGETVVSDTATTTMARAGRSLEIVGPKVMRMAAEKATRYIRDDIEGLLRGESHPPLLVKVSFNGVKEAWLKELRQGLGRLSTVQRFFKRGFSSGIFRADVILRKDKAEFLNQLKSFSFEKFTLEPEPDDVSGDLVFTLRKGPEPTPTPTPKRSKEWRR